MDDSSFVINWYELEKDSNNQLVWNDSIAWFNTKLSNQDNPEAFAVISWDDHNDPDGGQSVDLLLQTMDQTEAHDNKERERLEKLEQEKLELLKRIYGPND